jgi:uncharacterized protein (TIGR02266 family)
MEAEAAQDERRAHARLCVQVEVSLDSASELYTGLTGDVSRGGVFVQTWQPIPVGLEVDVELKLAQAEVLMRGIVRWRREASNGILPGVGIEFVRMDDPARDLLVAFCTSRAPLYHDVDDETPTS